MFSVLPQIMCAGEDQGGPSGEDDIANFRARAPALIAIMGECAAVEPCTAKRYHSILLQFAQAIVEGKERRQRYREELAQKTRELETREVVTRPAEPDLLDELQATSNEYFAVSYRSRAGSDEPPSRESLAAHALVSVASNGQDQNQMMPPPPYISVTESSMGVVSSMQQSGLEALHMEREPEIIAAGMAGMVGMGDFSNFFGWFEEGGFNESPAAVPWELSWDGPPNNYFASANPRMGPDGG